MRPVNHRINKPIIILKGLHGMPGAQDFGAMNYLRRTDSKDSNCTSLSSVSHMHGRDDLRASMSVPAVAFGVRTLICHLWFSHFDNLLHKSLILK